MLPKDEAFDFDATRVSKRTSDMPAWATIRKEA
jgi:hypothetical protein